MAWDLKFLYYIPKAGCKQFNQAAVICVSAKESASIYEFAYLSVSVHYYEKYFTMLHFSIEFSLLYSIHTSFYFNTKPPRVAFKNIY